jgi:23S rRNA (guanosine2251-2'-O)-methyltransferase
LEYLFRRHAVLETLRGSRRQLIRLWLQKGLPGEQVGPLEKAATARSVPVKFTSKQELDRLAGDRSHQGVVLETGAYPYSDLGAMLALAEKRDEKPFLLLLDLLHGPQNIGSLLRTAESCGVHGVVMQDRRAPDITPHVVSYAAGATEHLHIAQVTNLVEAMKHLQAEGVWLAGLDMAGGAYRPGEIDLDRSLGLVVGHEGRGLRRLVRETCDFLLQLPMRGQVASLNAAVAGSVALYLAWQARDFQL